ncbi:MAG: hypothetical protein R3F50_16545 [Gammaproteobacteria bacterium]
MTTIYLRKASFILLFAFALSACASKPINRPNAEAIDWEFIQSVGGVRLGDPYSKDGLRWVPVLADVSGSQTITTVPTLSNTGLVCSAAVTGGTGNLVTGMNVWLTIYVEPEPDIPIVGLSSRCNDIPLPPNFSAGPYRVYYEDKPKNIVSLNSRANLIGTLR